MVNIEELFNLKIGSQTPPDFKTHLNYIEQMNKFSKGLDIKLNIDISSKSSFSMESLSNKLNLIKIIKHNLEEEHKGSLKERDFAKVCSVWISVKAYYLMFNMTLILCALINNNLENLTYSHASSISNFRNFIKNKQILFSQENFNTVLSCLDANNFKLEQNKSLTYDLDEKLRFRSILKKLCAYKFEDFCRFKGLKHFRTVKNREKKEEFFTKNEISLFEFFYWYRIKANYKDLNFLDQDVHSTDIIKFYDSYYEFTLNFYNALKNVINEASKKRFGKNLIED